MRRNKGYFGGFGRGPLLPPAAEFFLHVCVFWTTAALWRHPGDVFIRVFHVTGLAVQAIGKVQLEMRFAGLFILFHFVDVCRAEVLARRLIFFQTAVITYIQVQDLQVRRLLFLMGCARIIDVGLLIEGLCPVEFDDLLLLIRRAFGPIFVLDTL